MLIVGTFRSATNAIQTALAEHYEVEPVFNDWFWKHGVPPTTPSNPVIIPQAVPIIVMSKDPVAFNESIFRFWRARRPELNVGDDISVFIREKFVVYDNTGGDTRPRYRFPTATEYWNQFYFSWLNWKEVQEQTMFVRCEDLMKSPDLVLGNLGSRFGLRRKTSGAMALPQKRVGPTSPAKLEDDVMGLSARDVAWIKAQTDSNILSSLGYSKID